MGNGFIQLPNDVFDEIRDPVKLQAYLWLMRHRDYETGALQNGIRALARQFDKSHSWARSILAYAQAHEVVRKSTGNTARLEHGESTERAQFERGQIQSTSTSTGDERTDRAQLEHAESTERAHNTISNKTINKKTTTTMADESGFLEFWSQYPRKVAKANARAAWNKLKPDAELRARIQRAVTWQRGSPDWTKDDGRFIPHAATWLHNSRWEDERPQARRVLEGRCDTCGKPIEATDKYCGRCAESRGLNRDGSALTAG